MAPALPADHKVLETGGHTASPHAKLGGGSGGSLVRRNTLLIQEGRIILMEEEFTDRGQFLFPSTVEPPIKERTLRG